LDFGALKLILLEFNPVELLVVKEGLDGHKVEALFLEDLLELLFVLASDRVRIRYFKLLFKHI
jgi:hypothetical protein